MGFLAVQRYLSLTPDLQYTLRVVPPVRHNCPLALGVPAILNILSSLVHPASQGDEASPILHDLRAGRDIGLLKTLCSKKG